MKRLHPLELEAVLAHLADSNPEAILYEPREHLDAAIVGVAERCGQPTLVVYSFTLLVEIYTEMLDSAEAAIEWIGHNIEGGWVGPNTPVILHQAADGCW